MAVPKNPLESFLWGAGGAALTPDEIARRREMEQALVAKTGIDTSPVGHWTQGLARVLGAAGGAYRRNRLDRQQGDVDDYNSTIVQSLLGGASPAAGGAGSTMPMAGASGEIAATAPSSVDISGDRQAFVDSLLPAAIEESKRTGIDPRIIVAQAAQETGWGKSAPGNNFFGIKSHGQSGGNSMMTTEVIDGKPVRVRDSFRAYGSPADSVRGYGDFILANPRYSDFRSAQGIDAQLAALQASGYATDPNYSRSVGAIARGIQLPQETASATAEDAFGAVMPGAGGATFGDPTLVYDDKGARMEPESYATPDRQNPQQAISDQTNGIPQQFQGSQQLMGAQGGIVPALMEGQPASSQQVAQALATGSQPQRSQINPAILRALADPRANAQTRGVAELLLKQSLADQQTQADRDNWLFQQQYQEQAQARDPLRQAQIEALKAKQDGIPESVKALNIRAQQAGLVPGTKEYNDFMISGGKGPLVNVNTGSNNSKFVEKSDEAAAKRFDEIVSAGQTAPQTIADMQQLIDLGAQIGTGPGAQIKAALGPYAQSLGIDIANMQEIQAYDAITSRLAPQMRAVGSGSSSDRDVALFFKSLPNLRNVQGGNEIIANTMKAVAQNKINAAEIARRAQRGEIPWQEADKLISELPNPYDLFKEFQAETRNDRKSEDGIPQGVDPEVWQYMTPEEKRLFQ